MLEIIYIILALLLGILGGAITGLIPGIHINLVSAFLLASSAFFLSFLSPIVLVVFIVALTISDIFISFIPSIFLGAPDEDTTLSILPGHELLLKGKGYEALILTLYGSISGVLIIFLLALPFIFILPKAYSYLKFVMFFILIFTSICLIAREKKSIALSLLVFFLSGFLGLSTLNLTIKDPLLPLLTGLFGSSSLITSMMKKTRIPKQKILAFKKIKVNKKDILDSGIASILSAPLCSFLPALGSGQAAVISSDIIGETDRKKFLILLGSINTVVAGLSFVALYSIQKARTGTSVAVQKILENFSFSNLAIILLVILFAGAASFFLTILLGKFFAEKISLFSYKKLSVAVLIFLYMVVFIFSGFLGFVVFIIATFTGLTAILTGIRRTNLMGCLMLPAILLYLPF